MSVQIRTYTTSDISKFSQSCKIEPLGEFKLKEFSNFTSSANP